MTKKNLTIYLANPRGFCAGVERAIQTVEKALDKYGAPVYVRHEIVHNQYVLQMLKEKGAIFVEELDQVPDDAPVIFSAHGVPKSVPENAEARKMTYIDATCPLVSKVHLEAQKHHRKNNQIILIGHKNHPEVIGTMGQLPKGEIVLIETISDIDNLKIDTPENLAYITQTTLSVDDTVEIIKALKQKFPLIKSPKKEDICYATTNRQNAVKDLLPLIDMLFVLGAPNSSNSRRLVDVAKNSPAGIDAYLIQNTGEINWSDVENRNLSSIGITAGASAPDILVDNVIADFKQRFNVTIKNIETATEDITFNLPRILYN